ncbi:MAG: sel1 repeat family protein, partial [Methylocystis sp.]|nr:sel1 repeat family protein [Methylocystis sp.]
MRLAAVRGDPDAQINLGAMYFGGEGGEQDAVRGYMWTQLAADSPGLGQADRKKILQWAAEPLTAEQRAKGEALAKKCRESSFKLCD